MSRCTRSWELSFCARARKIATIVEEMRAQPILDSWSQCQFWEVLGISVYWPITHKTLVSFTGNLTIIMTPVIFFCTMFRKQKKNYSWRHISDNKWQCRCYCDQPIFADKYIRKALTKVWQLYRLLSDWQ